MHSNQTPDKSLHRPRQPVQDRFAVKLGKYAGLEASFEKSKFDSPVICYAITGCVAMMGIGTLVAINAHWAQSLLLLIAELVVCGFIREHDVRHKN